MKKFLLVFSPFAFLPSLKGLPENRDSFFGVAQQLKKHLFSNYDRQIPSLYVADSFYSYLDQPFQVNSSLMFCKLFSIDQVTQGASMSLDFYHRWMDSRLSWNATEFGGMRSLTLTKKDSIWMPDVFPFDMLSFSYTVPEEQQLVHIYSNGTISYNINIVIEYSCGLDLTLFPFDTQTCLFKIGSLDFPINEMVFRGRVHEQVFKNREYTGNGEWTLLNVTVEDDDFVIDDVVYSQLVFSFIFARSTVYYVTLIMIPAFILTFLCVIGLFWEPIRADSFMEHLTLGFSAILAMMFVIQIVTQDVPKISHIDLLSIYLTVNLAIITVASLTAIILGKLSHLWKDKERSTSRCHWIYTWFANYHNLLLMFLFFTIIVVNFLYLLV